METLKRHATDVHVFYGWWIVASGVVLAALQSTFYVYGFGVFYMPLLKELNTNRAALGGVIGLSRIQGGLLAPAAGWLIDRYGPRRLLAFGILAMGACFFAFSRITTLWMLYAVFFALAAAASIGGGQPITVAVANWFIRRRGLAMGILMSGFGLGGTFLWALAWLIETFGWRTTAVIGGLLFWIIGLPLAKLIHHRPEQRGLLPDGAQPYTKGVATQTNSPHEATPLDQGPLEPELTPREALRTRSFWMLAIAYGVWATVVAVSSVYQIPFLNEELNIPLVTAAFVVSCYSLVSIPGRIVFGWLGDVTDIRNLLVGVFFLQALGLLALSLMPNLSWTPLYILILAPAYGGSIPLRMSIVGYFYGRRNYGTINGLLQFVDLPGTVGGPIFVGWVFDSFGSYRPGFQVIALLMAIGAFTLILARRPQTPVFERNN